MLRKPITVVQHTEPYQGRYLTGYTRRIDQHGYTQGTLQSSSSGLIGYGIPQMTQQVRYYTSPNQNSAPQIAEFRTQSPVIVSSSRQNYSRQIEPVKVTRAAVPLLSSVPRYSIEEPRRIQQRFTIDTANSQIIPGPASYTPQKAAMSPRDFDSDSQKGIFGVIKGQSASREIDMTRSLQGALINQRVTVPAFNQRPSYAANTLIDSSIGVNQQVTSVDNLRQQTLISQVQAELRRLNVNLSNDQLLQKIKSVRSKEHLPPSKIEQTDPSLISKARLLQEKVNYQREQYKNLVNRLEQIEQNLAY